MARKIGRLSQFIIKEIVEPDNDSDYISTDDERENVTDEDS